MLSLYISIYILLCVCVWCVCVCVCTQETTVDSRRKEPHARPLSPGTIECVLLL